MFKFNIEKNLLHNAEVKMAPQFGTFKQAQRVQQSDAEQPELGLSTRYNEKYHLIAHSKPPSLLFISKDNAFSKQEGLDKCSIGENGY